jgi:MEMO1 family protein
LLLDRIADTSIIEAMKETIGQVKGRDATVAGIFYPDDPSELEARVRALLEASKPAISGARAILSPHAGLDYSGDLSGLAWKSAAQAKIDTVLILSPLHRAEESHIYLPESDYFDIPTGRLHVDKEIVEALAASGGRMRVDDIPHFEEHGIELQLPFMVALFPKARLVPILLGKTSPQVVKELAAALGQVFAGRIESTLVVLSSDLGSATEEHIAAACADRFLRSFLAEDSKALLAALSTVEGSACGTGCASAYFSSGLSKGMKPLLLARHDSSASRETGEERLVHYAAVALSDG